MGVVTINHTHTPIFSNTRVHIYFRLFKRRSKRTKFSTFTVYDCSSPMVSMLIVSAMGFLSVSTEIARANACWRTILEHSSYLAYIKSRDGTSTHSHYCTVYMHINKNDNTYMTCTRSTGTVVMLTFASTSLGFLFITASKSFKAYLNLPKAMLAVALL